MKKLAIAADIGGSHITCQLFDIENNIPVEDLKWPINLKRTDYKQQFAFRKPMKQPPFLEARNCATVVSIIKLCRFIP